MGIFKADSPLMQKLALLFDLMVLNILTVVFSIPIVTIGASTTALYDALWRIKKQKGSPLRDYWRAFRSNFKQATLLFIPVSLLGLSIGYALLLSVLNPLIIPVFVRISLIICAIVWIMAVSWVYPLQSRFVNTWGRIIINALLCALRFLPRTVMMSVLNLLPWIVLAVAPAAFLKWGIFWLLLWFGLAAYWNICLLDDPFRLLIESASPPNADQVSGETPFEA